MAEVRLALIMGGGVSLGTYTAGALTELYYALREINRAGSVTMRVEVLVGASAGAMTAALFAKTLACDDPAVTELMYEAWVNQIDISKLAPANATTFNPLSLLQSDIIDTIGATTLIPPPPNAPWSYAADTLRLGFTGTNLGGIPLSMTYDSRDGAMVFDDHADAFIVELNKADPPQATTDRWERIRRAAIASGAFPAAFPPRQVDRGQNEDPIADFEFLSFPNGTPNPVGMWYCDGGVFDNEPIGLAKKLVSKCAGFGQPGIEYRYIVIDHDLARNQWKPFDPPQTLVSALGGVVGAIMEQGTSKDYLRAMKINEHANSQRVAVKGQLLPLVTSVQPGALPALAAGLAKTLEETITIHFFDAIDEPTAVDVASMVAAQRARVSASADYAESLVGLTVAKQAALVDAILISEVTAGLLDKRMLDINIVAPPIDPTSTEPALAGAFLWNFGGFFEQKWRQHDFDCGRRDARTTLTADMKIAYTGDANANYSPVTLPTGVVAVSSQRRTDLQTYLTKRIEALIRPSLDEFASSSGMWAGIVARAVIPRIPAKMAQVILKKIGLG